MTGAELTAFLAEWLLPICGVVHFGMLIAVLRSIAAMRAVLEIHSQFFIDLAAAMAVRGVVPAGSRVAGAEAGGGVQPPPGFQPDISGNSARGGH